MQVNKRKTTPSIHIDKAYRTETRPTPSGRKPLADAQKDDFVFSITGAPRQLGCQTSGTIDKEHIVDSSQSAPPRLRAVNDQFSDGNNPSQINYGWASHKPNVLGIPEKSGSNRSIRSDQTKLTEVIPAHVGLQAILGLIGFRLDGDTGQTADRDNINYSV